MTAFSATTSTAKACQALLFAAHSTWNLDPVLTDAETAALAEVAQWRIHCSWWTNELSAAALRLTAPIDAVTGLEGASVWGRYEVRRVLLRASHDRGRMYWAWDRATWVEVLSPSNSSARHALFRVAYLAADQRDLHRSFPQTKRRHLVEALFGADAVAEAVQRINIHLGTIGFANPAGGATLLAALFELMLQERSARLEDVASAVLAMDHYAESNHWIRSGLSHLARTLRAMGFGDVRSLTPPDTPDAWLARTTAARADVSVEWADCAQRWYRTSTLSQRSRMGIYYNLLKVGRWLAAQHREVTNPSQWTREVAADWVSAVVRMKIGEYSHAPSTVRYATKIGLPLSARSKHQHITMMGRFMRDCIDWGWTTLAFDPSRVLRTPRSVSALIGPDPRVVSDDIWAKLLWAGLNLTGDDLPAHGHSRSRTGYEGKPWYPLAMVRAVALVWLFSGLRGNEILRLRVGCVRWQTNPATDGTDSIDVCLLDVPVTKTSTSFTKPIDPIVGQAIDAWMAARPAQPRFVDTKTGESVDMLFALRGFQMSDKYINRVLIPLLCRKANVPTTDIRGPITAHRARSTIATMLYNAKDPMTLFELQTWLGHRSPSSTQQYARISPVTLTKAYNDAGYFGRNLRTIEVLIDRDAIRSGTAATGTPWEFFDLGHGWCTYNFFEQCPHRMACARCDFYIPKPSTAAQLLEANTNLARMLIEIPLTDDERAAVEEGQDAMRTLLDRLADTPTPAGPTPRTLAGPVPVAAPRRRSPGKPATTRHGA